MREIIQHGVRIFLDTIEAVSCIPAGAFLYWLFSFLGHAPKVEPLTHLYVGLWAYVMVVAAYETVRALFERGFTAR